MHFKPETPEFKIEKGIPVPKKEGRFDFLKHMKVGESFVIPEGSNVTYMRIHIEAKKRGISVKTAETEGGLRVWRVFAKYEDVIETSPKKPRSRKSTGNEAPQDADRAVLVAMQPTDMRLEDAA